MLAVMIQVKKINVNAQTNYQYNALFDYTCTYIVNTDSTLISSAQNVKEANVYEVAIDRFVRDYGYLPGDFPYANETFCPGTNDCTVNGDGDGFVGTTTSGPTGIESLNFFHHLSLLTIIAPTITIIIIRTIVIIKI